MGVKMLFNLSVLLHCILLTLSYQGKLLYSNVTSIMEFDIGTRKATVLVEHSSSVYTYAMDYDYKHRFIYFSRQVQKDIVRFAYPSKNIKLHTVIQSLSFPSGIAVDPTNDHIYWVDYFSHTLSRCNLDGSNFTVLSSLSDPFVIRLDLANRWMYIVERTIGISKSRFDLFKKETIVNFVSSEVYCMDIDSDENRLFWIVNNNGDLKSASYDGSDVTTIRSTNNSGNKLAISVLSNYIFYADHTQLFMVTKTPGSKPTFLYTDTSRIDSIFVFNQSGPYES